MIHAIRKDYPRFKIIAISGAFRANMLKTAAVLGAQATLIKPMTAEQVLRSVTELLE